MALVDIQSHPAGRAGHGGGRGPEMVLGCLPENDLVCQAYAVCRYHMHARCIMIHRRVSQIHYGRSCIICYMNADDDHSGVWYRSVPFVSYNIGTFTTGRMGWMAHRKWKEIKLQPSMLPGPAVPGSCLASFHFRWGRLILLGKVCYDKNGDD